MTDGPHTKLGMLPEILSKPEDTAAALQLVTVQPQSCQPWQILEDVTWQTGQLVGVEVPEHFSYATF